MSASDCNGVSIREAIPGEGDDLLAVLDSALLQTDRERLRKRVSDGSVLVAVRSGTGDADSVVLGTVVLDGTEITSIAVRPGRRGQGIGRALVAAASGRGPLTATFDPRVREFYESLGFEVEPLDDSDRLLGSLDDSPDGSHAGIE